jgi:hypothetical protein
MLTGKNHNAAARPDQGAAYFKETFFGKALSSFEIA